MITLLTAHSRAEESDVYPAAAEADLAADVAAADPQSPDFDELLSKLVEAVTRHVEEEESTVLPGMRANLSTERLDELGQAFLASRSEHLGDMPADITKSELEQQAVNVGVPGASSMSKSELKSTLADEAEE